jgi:hypothetical protein
MDDNNAEDMRCGDLSESQLKRHYHLVDVSARVNPYTLSKISAFTQPQSMFQGTRQSPASSAPLFCLMNFASCRAPFRFMVRTNR